MRLPHQAAAETPLNRMDVPAYDFASSMVRPQAAAPKNEDRALIEQQKLEYEQAQQEDMLK